jgi:UPF0042 nucleotide-binding protein
MTETHVVIVTGLSGAGRSHAAKVLEDVGYFVVDNLPSELIGDVVDRTGVAEGGRAKLAVVVDARGGLTHRQLEGALLGLHGRGLRTSVLFLDAEDAALVRRYEENRRPHPVAAGSLAQSIAAERAAFEEIRGEADVIIDTTDLSVHDLRRRVTEAFADVTTESAMRVDVSSFGFKRGVPRVVDLLFDARFLPNPHWVLELRPLTGLDEAVRDYVFESSDAREFMARITNLLDFLIPRYEAEGKSYLTIGVGCTGGRHRSVAIAEAIGDHLRERGVDVTVHHRDSGVGDAAHRH